MAQRQHTDTSAPQRTLIVVGSDGSSAAQPAIDFAVQEAVLRQARLLVVAAYSFPVSMYPLQMVWIDDYSPGLIAATRAGAQTALDSALERAGHPKLECTVEVHEGRPAEVLIDEAAEAQLLVVGARGLGRWGRMTLGSTSTEVMHHATVPVAVIRNERAEKEEPGTTRHETSAVSPADTQPALVRV